MTELEIQILAAEISTDDRLAPLSREKRLANAILTYFDPEHFLKAVDRRLDRLAPHLEMQNVYVTKRKERR